MLLPATFSFTCYIGGTWDQEIDFWANAGETVAYDFTGWTVTAKVLHSDGSSTPMNVQVTGGAVVLSLGSDITSAFVEGSDKFVVTMTMPGTPPVVEYPAHGNFTIKSP